MFSLSLSIIKNNMNKEFIPYDQALALKELGFDEPCFRWYDERWGDDLQQDKFNTNKDLFMTDLDCSAPLYQQVFRWFRENHGLWQIVMQNTDKDWTYDILPIIGITDYRLFDVFDTYEEAELHCLKKLIEIVKGK
jgi:hypothetical protein